VKDIFELSPSDALAQVRSGEGERNDELVREVAGSMATGPGDLDDSDRVGWARVALAALERTDRSREDKLIHEIFHRCALVRVIGPDTADELRDPGAIRDKLLSGITMTRAEALAASEQFRAAPGAVPVEVLRRVRAIKNLLRHAALLRTRISDDVAGGELDAWLAVRDSLV
jgi:hypothetical protein